jgi:hypothetical protein
MAPRMICVTKEFSTPTDSNIVVPKLRKHQYQRELGNRVGKIILEEVIGPGQLLEGHDGHAKRNPFEHCASLDNIIPFMRPLFFHAIYLLLHLKHLVVDNLVIFAHTMEAGHNNTRFVLISAGKLKAWCIREEHDADAYNYGPKIAKANWQAPGGRIRDAFSAEIDKICDENAESDAERKAATDCK